MPITVPRYNEAQVDPNNESLPRAHGLSPEAFGAGLARGLNSVAGNMNDLARKAVADANTAATLNARNFLFQVESDTLYGDNDKPGQGILKKKGLAAAQDEQTALESFKRRAEEYERTLSNDDQKLTFRTMASERFISMQKMLAQHSRNEMNWHQDETLKATEQASFDRVGMLHNQPNEVDREIAIIKFARNKRLDDLGLGNDPESAAIRAGYLKDAESKARNVVIGKMQDEGRYEEALDYLERHKEAFNFDEKVNAGTMRKQIEADKRTAELQAAKEQKEKIEAARQEANKHLVDLESSGKLNRRTVSQYRTVLNENEYREWNDRITRRAEKLEKAASGEGDGFKTNKGLQMKLFRAIVRDPSSVTESEIIDRLGDGLSYGAAQDLISEKRRREKGEVDPARMASEKAVIDNLKRARKSGLLGEGAEGETEYIRQTEAFKRWMKAHPKDDPSEYFEKVIMAPKKVGFISRILDTALGPLYDPTKPDPKKRREEMEAETKPARAPKAGDVVKGYRFKGGNPADRKAWVKL